ncbi:hypothetical protein [Tunturiibacter gelidiferens]|uniref:hypothetical protein n=1 Tax=Tunturiibacter gelidiferens TaxID=3069689 RepID=UPI003D9BBE94
MWHRYWSLARYDLKLMDDDFWDMTPKMFDALLKRQRVGLEIADRQFAQLTWWVANTGQRTPKKETTYEDFLVLPRPGKSNKVVETKRIRMTKQKRLHLANSLREVLGRG